MLEHVDTAHGLGLMMFLSTLYYACQFHTTMQGQINVLQTAPVALDVAMATTVGALTSSR